MLAGNGWPAGRQIDPGQVVEMTGILDRAGRRMVKGLPEATSLILFRAEQVLDSRDESKRHTLGLRLMVNVQLRS